MSDPLARAGLATDAGPDHLYEQARQSAGDAAAALALAPRIAEVLPLPGSGSTIELWEGLARLGMIDLTVARTIEPQLDARAILAEAGDDRPSGTWGVFAAEGPGVRLSASSDGDAWTLDGVKPWCSLAAHLDHALVTAWVDDAQRGLFAVDLQQEGVTATSGTWVARGLPQVTSESVEFAGVPATAVGDAGWYLRRPGFAWGGIGVAAVWFGAAVALASALTTAAGKRKPDQIALMHIGRCDAALHATRCTLRQAAADIDAGAVDDPGLLAARVRTIVAQTCETVMTAVDHGLGPGPLVGNEEHAARVADLHLYVRQWHAERDLAAIGSSLVQE